MFHRMSLFVFFPFPTHLPPKSLSSISVPALDRARELRNAYPQQTNTDLGFDSKHNTCCGRDSVHHESRQGQPFGALKFQHQPDLRHLEQRPQKSRQTSEECETQAGTHKMTLMKLAPKNNPYPATCARLTIVLEPVGMSVSLILRGSKSWRIS